MTQWLLVVLILGGTALLGFILPNATPAPDLGKWNRLPSWVKRIITMKSWFDNRGLGKLLSEGSQILDGLGPRAAEVESAFMEAQRARQIPGARFGQANLEGRRYIVTTRFIQYYDVTVAVHIAPMGDDLLFSWGAFVNPYGITFVLSTILVWILVFLVSMLMIGPSLQGGWSFFWQWHIGIRGLITGGIAMTVVQSVQDQLKKGLTGEYTSSEGFRDGIQTGVQVVSSLAGGSSGGMSSGGPIGQRKGLNQLLRMDEIKALIDVVIRSFHQAADSAGIDPQLTRVRNGFGTKSERLI